nr:MAG TPA: hypothetical protein [Caudoviricetes sp.]
MTPVLLHKVVAGKVIKYILASIFNNVKLDINIICKKMKLYTKI